MSPAGKQRVFVALGGNIGEPTTTFKVALKSLSTQIGPLKAVSSCYETRALTLGDSPQRNYSNAVAEFESELTPEEILKRLLEVERSLGRDRTDEKKWGPRLIDLDLLFVGQLTHRSDDLTLPHPELMKRDFVLIPLAEIAEDFVHPINGHTIRELRQMHDQDGAESFVLGVTATPTALADNIRP